MEDKPKVIDTDALKDAFPTDWYTAMDSGSRVNSVLLIILIIVTVLF